MSSAIEVVNLALRRLGAARITSFTDGTPEANLAQDTFAGIRDSLLREHTWNFATRRASLAASTTTPLWGFERQFPIPADFLRLVEVQDAETDELRVESDVAEGRVFRTNLDAPLLIAYIARIEDANQWDPSFQRALALRCAMEWAESLTGSTSIVQQVAVEYELALRAARTTDGQEDTPAAFRVDTWTNARL